MCGIVLFALILYVSVNSYGHVESVNFLLGKPGPSGEPLLCAHTFAFLNQGKENVRSNYFMIDLHGSTGPGQDQTHNPWICNWKCHRLRYTA